MPCIIASAPVVRPRQQEPTRCSREADMARCLRVQKFQPRTKHPQGTEIKAITYSAMQILVHPDGNAELYVIVDI
eukprot:1590978-Rhodomonas_salina.2